MAGKSYKNELEELEMKYIRALEMIKRLESRVSSLERENARLRHQLEVLRKDADECKTKYERLKGIVIRALEIADGQVKRMTFKEMKMILNNEFGSRKKTFSFENL